MEDIVIWTAFTFRKTILNYLGKLSEKTLTIFAFSLKILKNINHIYNYHVREDMTREEIRKFCRKCWEKPYGFAVIDLTSKKDAGKYRGGFDNFFYILIINGS